MRHEPLIISLRRMTSGARLHAPQRARKETIDRLAELSYLLRPMAQMLLEVLVKRTPIIAALMLSTVSSSIAQQQSARPRAQTSTEQAVQEQDQKRIHAQITADSLALRRIYADDFIGIGPTGVVRNKADVIADFTSHALTYQSITTADVRVRVYGNTAVQTGRSSMVGQDRGKTVPRENRFTRVWVMKAGRWQLVANHYSLLTSQ